MNVWINGQVAAQDAARLDPRDRGFLLGDGVFDTLGVFEGRIFRPEKHVHRLRRHAAVLGIKIPYDDETLHAAAQTLAEKNISEKMGAVRITVSRGPGARGLLPPDDAAPTVLMMASPVSVSADPARLIVSSVRRNEGSPASRIKSLNYLDNILARMEAQEKGADEALMLNSKGLVCCVAAGNIFIVRQKTLFTPRLEDGVLDGVTRATVLELAARCGLAAHEVSLTPEQVDDADEVFLTSSLAGIRPVRAAGEITALLQAKLQNEISR